MRVGVCLGCWRLFAIVDSSNLRQWFYYKFLSLLRWALDRDVEPLLLLYRSCLLLLNHDCVSNIIFLGCLSLSQIIWLLNLDF